MNRVVSALGFHWWRFDSVRDHYIVGSPDEPVADVYEATLAARAVYRADPGYMASIIRLFGRLFRGE
jgi:predicted metallopeptidase